jgi:hypothetical protein
VATLLLLLLAMIPTTDHQYYYVVGVDPNVYEIVAAGAQGWNDTGHVYFDVQPTGCGTGHITFCYQGWLYPNSVAAFSLEHANPWLIGLNASLAHLFTPAVACHEFGHFLGLRYFADGSIYHRSDNLSCMTDGSLTMPAYPDTIDLTNLGWSVVPVVEESVIEGPSHDGTWIDYPN